MTREEQIEYFKQIILKMLHMLEHFQAVKM